MTSIGEVIKGKYRILDEVGQGSVATVYLAKDLERNQVIALKIIHPHLIGEGQFLERFQREARLLARLDSPHVVQVLDFGADEDEGLNYIAMEFIEGHTLSTILEREGPLEVERALDITHQVAWGLQHAHDKGMVHRDIRPANIMVTPEGRVKVMDFGIARGVDLSHLTATGILGSPHYLSPEQVEGKTDIRSDIYSLGVTLYEMLAGEKPYEGESAVDIVLKHLQEPVPSLRKINPEIPAEVDKLAARCLAKDPADRFQIPADLIEAINKVLAKAPEGRYQRAEEVKAEERRPQQEKLAALYAEAAGFLKAKEWQKTLDKWTQVQAIDPNYPDPQKVAATAERELERLAGEKRRQEKLAALYTEAVRFTEAKEWQKALDKWAEVQAIEPEYPDRKGIVAQAKEELAPKVEVAAPVVELVPPIVEKPVLEQREAVPLWQRVPVQVWGAAIGGVVLLAVAACAIAGVLLVPRVLEKEKTPTPTLTRTTVAAVKETVPPTPTLLPTYTPYPTYTPMPTDTPVLPTPTPLPPTDTPTPTETPTPISVPIPTSTPTPEVDFKIVKQDMRHIRPDKCDDQPEIEVRVLDKNGEPLNNVRFEVYWDGGSILKNSGWLGPGYDKATVTGGTFLVKVTGGVPPFDERVYTSEVSRPLSTDRPTREDLEKAGYCQPGGGCAECSLYSYEVVFQRQW